MNEARLAYFVTNIVMKQKSYIVKLAKAEMFNICTLTF